MRLAVVDGSVVCICAVAKYLGYIYLAGGSLTVHSEDDGIHAENYLTIEGGTIDIQKSYPLYYGYRAIGAFTKRIPKKPVLYYEGSILFKTFIPLRDDSGKLQPDRRMFTDG